jgi:autotransporter-associated beta strand protein
MRMQRTRATGSFTALLADLFGSRQQPRARRLSRLAGAERFEERKLLALTVTSIGTPAVGAANVDLGTDLVFTFNANVLKGQGNIYVVEQSAGQVGLAVDVRSSAVTIAGNQVSVDLPADLIPDNTYSVFIDPGAFIDTSSTPTAGATLLTQNFDFVALRPFINENGGDGTDFSTTPQFGFDFQTTLDPMKGIAEWRGWSFADKNSWIAADNQGRDQFTLGSGTVMVADTDEYDDGNAAERPWVGYSYTPVIDLAGVAANSVKLEFDSSFRPEGPGDSQVGTLEVTFDGGTTWTQLLRLDEFNTSNDGSNTASRNINERLVSGTSTGVSTDGKGGAAFGAVTNPSSGTMQFRFWVTGTNDWWWAIDNMKVSGDIVGVPFAGLTSATAWTFSTPESPKFSLTIDSSAISENGGTATATLSRNVGPLVPSGEIVVTLTSSDESELTVPATVTIPAGQASVTFPITAVDDALVDRVQRVTVTAALDPFRPATAEIAVLDDEGPKVVSVTPGYGETGASYQSNLSVTFDRAVKKGAGIIRVVRSATGVQVAEIDVSDSRVVVSGTTLTVDLADLPGLTEFSVLIDDGVVVSSSTDRFPFVVLMQENFDALPLLSFADSRVRPGIGDGTDYTFQNPIGFTVDNSLMPVPPGTSPFEGWSYMDKTSWIAEQNDQSRSRFTLGSGVVAVADGDAWTDYPRAPNTNMTTFLVTRPVDLAGITAGSVSLQFDSSFYHELPQFGTVEVTYDGGLTWNPLLFFGDANVPGIQDGSSRNERISIDSTNGFNDVIGSAIVDAPLSNPDVGSLQFRFGYQNAGNNWWWAVDNIVIRGERAGEPFAGLVGDAWSFTTAEAPTLTVTIDRASITEKGTATGTVTRNLSTVGEVVVTLTSSDETEATVPATVVIPDGAASVTFVITAVDDTSTDGRQTTTISASAPGYSSVGAMLAVEDDDFPLLIGASPSSGATGVAVGSDVTLSFDMNVRKGNGFIHLVNAATGRSEMSINVQSPSVAVSGSQVTINPPANLAGDATYAVLVDSGAFLSAAAATSPGATLLTQDFDLLPLGPAVLEMVGLTPTGDDWTAEPPPEWSVDNSMMPPGGAPEWRGWTFAAKSFWATQGGQGRANFTLGNGTIAIADTDEWEDYARPSNQFESGMRSSPIDLSTVAADSVRIEFDSSFRPEGTSPDMVGLLDVSFDGGSDWTNLVRLDYQNTSGAATAANVNRREGFSVANPGAGSMVFRWTALGSNDWWWAIDNVRVTGTVDGAAFQGVTDPSLVTFSTAAAATISIAVASTALESASTLTATVNRTVDTSADLVVALASSDTTVATVPASVVIPAGQASASFVITILDDMVFDGDKRVFVTASAAGFVGGSGSIVVTDNETGDVIITEVMYDPAGAGGREAFAEYVEIYNRGSAAVDLSGWTLDDEDPQNWGAIASGTVLAPGQVGVLFNRYFGAVTPEAFRQAWNVPENAALIGIDWSMEDDGSGKQRGGLHNTPSAANEILVLRDGAGTGRNTVNLERGTNGWPAYLPGASVFLTNASLNNTIPSSWASSVAGTAGAVNPLADTYFDTLDVGSPGFVAVGPAEDVVTVDAGQAVTDTTIHTGDAVIVKRGAGTLVIDLANTHTGGIRVEAGTVILRNLSALNGGPLTVAAGARVVVDTGTSRINLSSLALDPAGSLELGPAGVIVASGGFDAAAVRQALIAGRSSGGWNGVSGITSATAATTAGRAVGYSVGSDGRLTIAFAAVGDTNLDGQFNAFDLVALQSGGVFGTGAASAWQTGDFNYDGLTNVIDLVAANGSGTFGLGNYNVSPTSAVVVSQTEPSLDSGGTSAARSGGSVNRLTFAAISAEQDRLNSPIAKRKAFASL